MVHLVLILLILNMLLVQGSSVTFATTDKGTKFVYAAADHASNPNLVDTGISTNNLTGVTGDITVDSPADIILDADGANVTIKDGGTTILDFVANGATDVTLDAPGDIKIRCRWWRCILCRWWYNFWKCH